MHCPKGQTEYYEISGASMVIFGPGKAMAGNTAESKILNLYKGLPTIQD